ncbi:MAG: hypothetical protein QXS76_00410 [Candidatus Bathyarchaeia archaeon]
MQKITKVIGISERRRLPRLGKIRLGVKVVNPKTGEERPREVPYFVVPPEVARVYGEKPVELDIMFPVNDPALVFPQAYKWYGESRGLKCIGDGQRAYRLNDTGEMVERECPCELLEKQCTLRAHLFVILPKVNMGGVYQIDIGSYNSIIDVNSGLDYVQALIGRFAMVPLKLRRVPREIPYEGTLRLHYPLQIFFDGDIEFVNQLRLDNQRVLFSTSNVVLPAIEDVNPKYDPDAVVVLEENGESEGEQALNPVNEPVQTVQSQKETSSEPEPAAKGEEATEPVSKPAASVAKWESEPATEAQKKVLRSYMERKNYKKETIEAFLAQLTKGEATRLISSLSSSPEIQVNK